MFRKLRNRKEWGLTFVVLAICSFHLANKWGAIWAGDNIAAALNLFIVPALAMYLLLNISALRLNSVEPRSEGTTK